jgi:hypothetical protein
MAGNTKEDIVAVLRTAFLIRARRPTTEFRRRAWLVFEAALDRHLAMSRSRRRQIQPQR